MFGKSQYSSCFPSTGHLRKAELHLKNTVTGQYQSKFNQRKLWWKSLKVKGERSWAGFKPPTLFSYKCLFETCVCFFLLLVHFSHTSSVLIHRVLSRNNSYKHYNLNTSYTYLFSQLLQSKQTCVFLLLQVVRHFKLQM